MSRAAAILLLAACNNGTVETAWRDNGLRTAAADLQCPAQQVQLIVVKRNDGFHCNGSIAEGRGCGKQARYTCDGSLWRRSGAVSKADPAPNEPLPSKPAGSADAGR